MASVSASVGIITHTVIRAAIPPSLSLLIQGSLVITHIWRKKIDFSFNQNLFWFFSLFSMKFMHFITLTSMRSSQDLQLGKLPVLPNHAKRHQCVEKLIASIVHKVNYFCTYCWPLEGDHFLWYFPERRQWHCCTVVPGNSWGHWGQPPSHRSLEHCRILDICYR